ncbi:6-phospho-3-hexuloisomerase [Marisediminicola senii]|uniref:6-phospho-3-hexuloisomerase n=1 Tax=Marisediminicola senii TaxID=2711233 RepID=UPI0013ECA545|nr:6-phospho-3-hexuloisomerase [Marisediminicola senii]
MTSNAVSDRTVADALDTIGAELATALSAVSTTDPDALDRAADRLAGAGRVFVFGAGRSGLALQMTAMRLMHFGLTAHVVGDATTPAIGEGDVLLVASGSGTTSSIVTAAEKAVEAGGSVVAITTDAASTLASIAAVTITVPAAAKLDRSGEASVQYAGGLFEQSVVVVGDALFHALWKASDQSADDMWPRHSNLE